MASVYEAWINFKGDIQHHWSCDLMKSRISPGYTGNQEKCTCGGWELMTAIEATEAAESRLAALEDVARAAQAVYNALEDGSLGARKELVVSLEQALSRAREAGVRLEEHIVDTNKMMPAPPGADERREAWQTRAVEVLRKVEWMKEIRRGHLEDRCNYCRGWKSHFDDCALAALLKEAGDGARLRRRNPPVRY